MDWSIIVSVVTINLLLSSDNALAIAMASRRVQPEYRKRALTWGSICAIVVQVILTYLAAYLLGIQYVKIFGGIILAWIAAKMIIDDGREQREPTVVSCQSLLCAVRAIAIANLVMSLDNVLAVAAVAEGNRWLLGLGLIISFPIIMWGSLLISGLLERFPVLVWLGAVFLGWTAGAIISSDSYVRTLLIQFDIGYTTMSALVALGISFLAWKTATEKLRVTE